MPVNVALIGHVGHWGHSIQGIPDIPEAKWTCFAPGMDGEEKEAGVINHPLYSPAVRKYEKWKELLDKENIQIAIVAPRYYLAAEIATECAKKGIHIICEKPLGVTLAGLESLKAAVKENNVKCSAMFTARYSPWFHAAYKAVREGKIGNPILATGQKSYKLGQRPDWMRARKTYGGTIPWVGIHAIDWVRWITGLEYVSVSAHHGNLANPGHNELEDSAMVLYKFNNGGSAAISIDYLRPEAADTHGDDRVRVAGSEGVVEVIEEKAFIIDKYGRRELEQEKVPSHFVDFYNYVYKDRDPIISTEDSFRVTEVALKARDAADQGKMVEL
ncbi:MAG: Gfo/Idh/MocA family oxidoreductase [bacterium]